MSLITRYPPKSYAIARLVVVAHHVPKVLGPCVSTNCFWRSGSPCISLVHQRRCELSHDPRPTMTCYSQSQASPTQLTLS